MRYKYFSNKPTERRRVTYSHVWWDGAFSKEELDNIEKMCSKSDLNDATTYNADIESTRKIRRSKVKFFDKDDTTAWIFDRFNGVGESLNEQFYGFDLHGYDSFQYTQYDYDDHGEYNWHMDMIMGDQLDNSWSNSTRKLTLIMLLSDENNFTGGELQLNESREENARTVQMFRGRIVAFPSWILHRVTPIITGQRKSIVIWIEGPKFI